MADVIDDEDVVEGGVDDVEEVGVVGFSSVVFASVVVCVFERVSP